jgi:hypothetical protein
VMGMFQTIVNLIKIFSFRRVFTIVDRFLTAFQVDI